MKLEREFSSEPVDVAGGEVIMKNKPPLTWKEFKAMVDIRLKEIGMDENPIVSFIDIYPLGSAATKIDKDIELNEDGELTIFGMW